MRQLTVALLALAAGMSSAAGYRTQYVEANGTQYIDTGVSYQPTDRIVVEGSFASGLKSQQVMIGWRSGGSKEALSCGARMVSNVGKFAAQCSNTSVYQNVGDVDTGKHTFDICSGSQKFDGVEFATDTLTLPISSGSKGSGSGRYYLFGSSNGWSDGGKYYNSLMSGRLYSCQIYQGNALVRDFIPYVQDGVAGMYDQVEGKFYGTTVGGNTLVAGLPVEKFVKIVSSHPAVDSLSPVEGYAVLPADASSLVCSATSLETDKVKATLTGYRLYSLDANGARTGAYRDSTDASYVFTGDANYELEWRFTEVSYRLDASCKARFGQVTLDANDGWYAAGATATATVEALEGSTFLQWGGDGDSASTSVQVVMDRPRTLIAYFKDWVVDSAAKTLSNAQWVLNITLSGKNITIAGVKTASVEIAEVDLSGIIVDTAGASGYVVTAISKGVLKNQQTMGSFIATSKFNSGLDRATFAGCTNLTCVVFPNAQILDGQGYGEAIYRGAFYNCKGLTTVVMPALTKVAIDAFGNCSALEHVELENCTEVKQAGFAGCSSLKSVSFKPNLEMLPVSQSAFSGCTSLTNISCRRISSVSSMNAAFCRCNKLGGTLEIVKSSDDKPVGYSTFWNCGIEKLIVSAPNAKTIGYDTGYFDPASSTTWPSYTNASNLNEVVVTSPAFAKFTLQLFDGTNQLKKVDVSQSTNEITFVANAIRVVGPIDLYISKPPVFEGVNGLRTTAPSCIHVDAKVEAAKDQQAAWKAAVEPYAEVFADYKANRDDVPAGCIGVIRCAKDGSAAVAKGYFDYAYVVANYPPDGTVLLLK